MSRFSNLEDVYNTLVASNFDWSTLPATNKYRKYYEWKTNPDQRKLPEGSQQLQGVKKTVGLKAFGLSGTTEGADQVRVKMSGRSHTQIASAGGLGLYHLEDNITNYVKNSGFVPAKAHIAVKRESGVAVLGTSNRITGRPYRSYTGESYVIPFGKSTEADKEFIAQDRILVFLVSTHVVSFTPERLRRNQ